MKLSVKLGVVVATVVACFLIYPLWGVLYIFLGAICCGILAYTKADDDHERLEPLFPSTQMGTDVSSAWFGAKMDEEEAWRKQGEKEPRDQGH
jgi:hypothetical protein